MSLFSHKVELTVSEAQRNDFKEFQQLFSGFHKHHFEGESDFFLNPKRIVFDIESYMQLITDPRRKVYLLRNGSLSVGLLLVSIVEVPVGELQYPRTRPTIEMLFVREKYRHLGGASLLAHTAYAWAKAQGYDEIVTDVWEFSGSALSFFSKKEGFTTRSRRLYKNI